VKLTSACRKQRYRHHGLHQFNVVFTKTGSFNIQFNGPLTVTPPRTGQTLWSRQPTISSLLPFKFTVYAVDANNVFLVVWIRTRPRGLRRAPTLIVRN